MFSLSIFHLFYRYVEERKRDPSKWSVREFHAPSATSIERANVIGNALIVFWGILTLGAMSITYLQDFKMPSVIAPMWWFIFGIAGFFTRVIIQFFVGLAKKPQEASIDPIPKSIGMILIEEVCWCIPFLVAFVFPFLWATDSIMQLIKATHDQVSFTTFSPITITYSVFVMLSLIPVSPLVTRINSRFTTFLSAIATILSIVAVLAQPGINSSPVVAGFNGITMMQTVVLSQSESRMNFNGISGTISDLSKVADLPTPVALGTQRKTSDNCYSTIQTQTVVDKILERGAPAKITRYSGPLNNYKPEEAIVQKTIDTNPLATKLGISVKIVTQNSTSYIEIQFPVHATKCTLTFSSATTIIGYKEISNKNAYTIYLKKESEMVLARVDGTVGTVGLTCRYFDMDLHPFYNKIEKGIPDWASLSSSGFEVDGGSFNLS